MYQWSIQRYLQVSSTYTIVVIITTIIVVTIITIVTIVIIVTIIKYRCYCTITQSCLTLCDLIDCITPGFTISWSLLKFMPIESMMPSSHLILCRPLLILPSSFPSIRSFPVSWLFTSSGQSIGASALASVLPMNIQGWFPLGLTGLISMLSKGLSRVFTSTTVQKHCFFSSYSYNR